MDQIYEELLNQNLKYGDSIVVACSGGPDSMALLHILNRVKQVLDIEVICAHVNHNTGRKGQYEEQQFVQSYCRNHNIIFETKTIDNYGDDNFENEARSKRYHYFEKIIEKYKAKYLFTAHHGDDLIETILMRIVRGSTLKGYSGFSKIVQRETYQIIRPFIGITKEEIISYNKKNKIKYYIDSSNLEDIHTRNRYRKYIVPVLKKEDPKVHQKFYKYSKTLLEYSNYIDEVVQKVISKVYPQNIINIEEYKKLEKVIQNKVIYYILEKIYQDDLMLITDRHVELINNLINSKKPNSFIYLPNNIKAIKAYNNVTIIEEQEEKIGYEIEIIDYINLPNGKNIEVVNECRNNSNNVCRLNKSDINLPLRVRTRKNGDKINLKGMIGSKKVNDIFIDEKIEMIQRDKWPIVVDSNDTVIWIPGLKKSKFDKQKDEKYDIILKYY